MDQTKAQKLVDDLMELINKEKLEGSERLAVVSMFFSTEIACAFLSGVIDDTLPTDQVLDGAFEIIRKEVKDAISHGGVAVDFKGDC